MSPEQEAKEAAAAAVVQPQGQPNNEETGLANDPEEEPANEAAAEAVDDFFVPHAHLPENSIYRLTMTDVTGNDVDLSQFSGMVSLVVNTACR